MTARIRVSPTTNGVATLELMHPPLNILTRALLSELRGALHHLAHDAELRVALLTADGPHFSAGADVREHLPPEDQALIPEFLDTVQAMEEFPLPLIAAVRGKCLGAGFELIQAVDVVIAAESAAFGQPEIQLGVFPPVACVLLPRRIPTGLARWIVYSGDPITAREAAAAGLVTRVVADGELAAAAAALATRLSRQSAAALRLAKRAFRPGAAASAPALRAAGDIYLRELMATSDAVEGLQSFVEKRQPAWSNR